jgi:hypothetical protein
MEGIQEPEDFARHSGGKLYMYIYNKIIHNMTVVLDPAKKETVLNVDFVGTAAVVTIIGTCAVGAIVRTAVPVLTFSTSDFSTINGTG